MVASAGFGEFLRDQLAPLGRITMRRMFGHRDRRAQARDARRAA
jgi:TfoX/Sxy family transcriptional regulator of competence genes